MALKIWLPLNKDYKYIYDGVKKDLIVDGHQIKSFASPIGSYADYNVSTTGNIIIPNGELALQGKSNCSASIWAYNFKSDRQLLFFTADVYFAFGIWNNAYYLRTQATGDGTGTIYGSQRFIELGTPQINTWIHYAITFDNGTAKAYVNGNLIETKKTIDGDKMLSTLSRFKVGGHNSNYPFSGYVCDFRVYDNTLAEEDVKRIYQQKMFELVPYSGVKDVLFDRSGFMNMPLVNNGADFQTNCLYFDGTNDQLRPKVTNDGFNISGGTLSIWFTPTEKPDKNRLVYADEKSHMSIGFSSTGNSLVVRCGTSNGYTNALSTTGISWGGLNNVIVTYNNTMPQICLINGIVPSVYTTTTGFSETAGVGLTIGGRQYNTTSRFDGKIYKVAVYNKQLTQDEAVELYNSERGMFLPDDYIQLEYAQSDGNQYINTEIYTTNSTNLEVTVKTNNNGSHLFFGYFENSTNAFQFAQSSNGNCFICDIGNTSNRIVSNILGTSDFHILLEKNKSFYIDGKLIGSATNASIPTNKIIHLFKSSYYTATTTSVKIKNAKIWNDNILVRNFTPAKRKSDNVIGMYDMVSRQFFTNSGTGSFTGA